MREHFSAKGNITDCKILKNNYGESRRIGFVGYKTPEEAEAAVKYFNRSFIDTSRITVELSKPKGDPNLPRPWSVYSEGSTKYNKRHGIKPTPKKDVASNDNDQENNVIKSLYEEVLEKHKDNPKFAEFLQVMAPRAKSKTWANDDLVGLSAKEKKAVKSAIKTQRKQAEPSYNDKDKGDGGHDDDDDDDDEYQDLPSKNKLKNDDKDNDSDLDDECDNEDEDGDEIPQESKDKMSDMEWLRAHMEKKEVPAAKKKENTPKSRPEAASSVAAPEETQKTNEERIEETGRLFVRNLPYTATEEDLRAYFEPYGPLSEVHMPISVETKKPKGFAYIMYMIPEHAVMAYKECDNKYLQGRLLHIIPGDEKPPSKLDSESSISSDPRLGFMSSIKKQKELKKRASAGNDFNWNSLYMNADAVADSISNRLNISKADLLENDEGSVNPAVRLALAETHIIAETKQYFEENGVNLEAFESMGKHKVGGGKPPRSDTVILVKNVPYGTTDESIKDLFGHHGTLGRVLVPPSGTIAIVEFFEPSEARSAFRHLAYKRIKDAPIYLEKAPQGLFSTEAANKPDGSAEPGQAIVADAGAGNKRDIESILEASDSKTTDKSSYQDAFTEAGEAGSVLFVKNLSFDTTESTLQTLFSGIDGLRSLVIRHKKNTKIPGGPMLSMGFGFVEYTTKEQAKRALKAYQGASVDGHKLQLKISDRTSIHGPEHSESAGASSTLPGSGASSKAKSNKLIVKNVAFEATKKDIQDLFAPFGQLKSVRLPKNFSGGHRGFAFVEFLTPQIALRAKDQLKDTHLYGRHLVIDFEEDGSATNLEELRAKVNKQYRQEEEFNQLSSSGGLQRANKRAKLELEKENGDGFESD
ncbi:Multiple RNA-binding domain-containing protein 1 [Mycoemilia scoparia]|uniref:Multiple RNA-binding domain-containing protein 1 n=1 Tax=Mycoemilia scoparia TaxID=417184 RepID=A0A9W7ZKT1_9FUNG|nr:Multiple RNA-binding domain-containing protein 1 [Mycoemilia scoparia]